MEEKIATTIQSTQNLEELNAKVTKKFLEVRVESVSTTWEIKKGIWNLSMRHPPWPTAEEYYKENEDQVALQKNTCLDLDTLLQIHDALL